MKKLPREIRTCVCGCNWTFECKVKSEQKYITGHNGRIHPFPKSVLCKCGCGQLTKPGNQYINRHANRGRHFHHTKESDRRRSEALKGKNSPWYGKHHSEETKRKLSESHKGIPHSKESNRKISKALKGRVSPMKGKHHTKKTIRRIRKSAIKNWQNSEFSEVQFRIMRAGLELRPTKPERRLRNRLNHLFSDEYKYVGDGDTFIGGKCPDFINVNGQKKVIEMFGDYWHSKKVTGRTKKQEENQRIKHFNKYGFKTLIVWESELPNISKLKVKLLQFHNMQ